MLLATKRKILLWTAIIAAALVLAYIVHDAFVGRLILPQYFHIGPLRVHYYGACMAAAAAAAFYLALRRAPRYGVDESKAESLMLWLVLGGFLGARLYHVLSSASYYYAHPLDIIKIWNGGLSIYGAVLGGLATLAIVSKPLNLEPRTLRLLDWLVPSVLLGQIIGRFGNFFNYELFGYPTALPWKMYVPPAFRPEAYAGSDFFHPLFLYEALANAAILFFLMRRRQSSRSGALFFWYVLLYNAVRFFLEFLRIDSTFFYGARVNAYVSLLAALAAAGVLAYCHIHEQQNA